MSDDIPSITSIEDNLNRCGVYFLYNKNKELVYIGKSKNLLGRIKSTSKNKDVRYISFGFTDNIVKASIYEAYYVNKHEPELNKEYSGYDDVDIELPELEMTPLYYLPPYRYSDIDISDEDDSDILKYVRKKLSLTQKEMASEMGYASQQYVSMIENSQRQMSGVARQCLTYLAKKNGVEL